MGLQPRLTRDPRYHFILYSCDDAPGLQDKSNDGLVWNCDQEFENAWRNDTGFPTANRCSGIGDPYHLLFGWVPGWIMPRFRGGTSARVGGYLVLQVHLLNITQDWHEQGYGLDLYITRAKPNKLIGEFVSNTVDGYVHAHSVANVEAACAITSDAVLHPLLFTAHGHHHTTALSVWKVDAVTQTWSLIGCATGNGGGYIPVADDNIVVRKGDMIATRCTIRNDSPTDAPFGSVAAATACFARHEPNNSFLSHITTG